ncbi:MAG: radical SAM protein [Chloroflexi bacterium]|nr:radical SAM protein [Chloroflexota bacterium]
MLIQSTPDTITQIRQMGAVTLYEPAGDQPQRERYQAHSLADCITNVSTPKGSKPLLKTMITTACERNCYYCPFRAGHAKTKRVTISPEKLAQAFDELQRARQVDGMFLSSGIIKGSVTTQDKLIDTVEIVRKRYGYRGYIHLKIMPGAEYDQLYRAMQLADRVSVNLEAPTQERLNALAPKKDFANELLRMLQLAQQIKQQHPQEKLANTVTQFVVGAVGDTDLELLALSERLYRQTGVVRAYYSAFSPVKHTPLENVAATHPLREFRLYQASFLLRDYRWELEDLPFVQNGNLRTDIDPKKAYAELHLRQNPVEIMSASREQLMRVPNIGPRSADAIIRARRTGRISDLAHLRQLGMRAPEQAAPYVLLDGRQPPRQLPLF